MNFSGPSIFLSYQVNFNFCFHRQFNKKKAVYTYIIFLWIAYDYNILARNCETLFGMLRSFLISTKFGIRNFQSHTYTHARAFFRATTGPIMSFDIVLEKFGIANGEYRYSTGVRNFKHGQAVWWQAHPRTQREETEMRPPRPSKGDEFDQLMGLEPASINRQTPRSKPVAIPTPLTLFVRCSLRQ